MPLIRIALAFALVAVAAGALARDVRVSLGTRGAVVFAVPDDWRHEIDQADPDTPPTVVFNPGQGRGFQVLITPVWPSIPNPPVISQGALREQVQLAADSAQPRAVERDLPIIEFSGPAGYGAHFTATDREPEPDGYKYLTQGVFAASDLRVSFTILVNGNPAPVVQQALTALKTLKRERAKAGS